MKSAAKLNSLYEMYGMVEPKIRYCAAHRPKAAQVKARIEAAKQLMEIWETSEAKIASDGFFKSISLPAVGPVFGGNYYTDYGKQLEANATGAGAITKTQYESAQGSCDHKWGLDSGHQTCLKCNYCLQCKGGAPPLTKAQIKKLKKLGTVQDKLDAMDAVLDKIW